MERIHIFGDQLFVCAVLVLFMDEHRPLQLSCLVVLREQKGGSVEKGEREYGIEEGFITSERVFPFSGLYVNVSLRSRSRALNGDLNELGYDRVVRKAFGRPPRLVDH